MRAAARIEPQGDEPSLELGQGGGEGSASTQVLLAQPLLACECLSAFGCAALEEISNGRPQECARDTDDSGKQCVHIK